MTQEITIWTRVTPIKKDSKTKKILLPATVEHNHIELGWSDKLYPVSVVGDSKVQQDWKNLRWMKSYGYLENNKVIEIPAPGCYELKNN